MNELAASDDFDLVIATRDWHPPDHGSFVAHGGRCPEHCVQATAGAELHPGVDRSRIELVVNKGQGRAIDGYSGFEGTELKQLLRSRGIEEVTVVGLATDYCVKNAVLEALREGFRVIVDTEAVRGVDLNLGDSQRAPEEIATAGGTLR